ncbi:MAG: HlyD family efflux transporter periplasmic adaptor subunit [Dysgonamonadaceae bacterium]|jgi:HlyD family secretion protein|nr:HlyD family efflux transporter periplasmic adaptor subunit [Dysgonamonadaceae bacterium]
MDIKISPEIIKQRRRKSVIQIAVIAVAAIAASVFLVRTLSTGISGDDIYTSVVDRGAIEISISAVGKVVPLSEEIIVSPVSTKILEVYKKSGDQISEGEVILRLDLEAVSADADKTRDELLMKQYKLEQQKQSAQTTLSDLQMQIDINEMQLKRMEVLLRNEKYLDSIGASTQDKIRQSELDYEVAQLNLKQLKLKFSNQKQSSESDTKVMELDYRIAMKNAKLTGKTLSEAQVRSPRAATLTFVNDQTGSQVPAGSQLAIISDLNHFKVDAEISDSYGNKIQSGYKVTVKTGETELSGTVGNIVPSVKNGLINFTVLLDSNDSPLLRSGLKVDVYVINSIEDSALRIANRSYYTGAGEYDMWIIEGGTAKKRKVTLGESSYNYVQAVDGLKEGETVITSDMIRYNDKTTLKIK